MSVEQPCFSSGKAENHITQSATLRHKVESVEQPCPIALEQVAVGIGCLLCILIKYHSYLDQIVCIKDN
jgi:hypothetical protein